MKLAKMTFKAGDAYAAKLSKLSSGADEIAKKAIYKAAGIVADQIKKNLHAVLSNNATGELENSLGITKIKVDKDGNHNAKIGFDGYGSRKTKAYPKGIPNQLKARALESGTSTEPKRPFVRPAVKQTKKQAEQAMNQVIDEEIKKRMK
mgnify:CR=1 FL=1